MNNRMRIHSILGLIGLEFLTGLLTNFYTEIPESNPEKVLHTPGYAMVHAGLGTLLLLLVLAQIFIAARRRELTKATAIGSLSVFVAFVTGYAFVATQNDILSLVMGVAFLVAFAIFTVILRDLNTNKK